MATQDNDLWEKHLKPGRIDENGSRAYMAGPINFYRASQEQLGQRARTMAFGFSGYKRESMANSLGFLTKAQKQNWKNFTPDQMEKSVASKKYFKQAHANSFKSFTDAEGNQMYKRNMGAPLLTSVMTRGYALSVLAGTGKNGSHMYEPIAEMAAMSGAEIGFGIGSNFGGSMAKGIAGRTLGGIGIGVGGAVAAGGLAYGAAVTLFSAGSADNWMNKAAKVMAPKERLNVGFSQQQGQHSSQRQRILNKLSKSAINDRGQFMGNEAMALRGII